mgnify:CR=1 FL=1
MALSILIGILLGTAHVIQEIIPAYRANLTNFYNEFPILSPHSAVETWMLEARQIWKGLYSS